MRLSWTSGLLLSNLCPAHTHTVVIVLPDPAGGIYHSMVGSERHWLMQNNGCLLVTWAKNTRTNYVLDTT